MPITNTDAVLWYNVGEFGKAGYAVPNWSDDIGSLNPQILDWCYLVGRNLFHIMHHEDVDLRIPPSINTIKRIHKLYVRAGNILAGRAVPPGLKSCYPYVASSAEVVGAVELLLTRPPPLVPPMVEALRSAAVLPLRPEHSGGETDEVAASGR